MIENPSPFDRAFDRLDADIRRRQLINIRQPFVDEIISILNVSIPKITYYPTSGEINYRHSDEVMGMIDSIKERMDAATKASWNTITEPKEV